MTGIQIFYDRVLPWSGVIASIGFIATIIISS
jgi:hypothetical protein